MELNKPVGKWILGIHKHNEKFISERLKDYNLNRSQSSILIYLYNNGDGINQEELTSEMGVDKSTISRGIKSLIKGGYIFKKRSEDDKRVYLIYLSDNGNKLRNLIKDTYREWFSIIMEGIPEEEVDIILKNLEILFNKIKDDEFKIL